MYPCSNLIFPRGDLNAKHSSWNCTRANTSGNILFNLQLISNFFIHHPEGPTRYHQDIIGSPTTNDLMLTNSNLTISPPLPHEDTLTSDHVHENNWFSPNINALTRLVSTINTTKALLPRWKITPNKLTLSSNTLLCILTRNMLRRRIQRKSNFHTKHLLGSLLKQIF